MARLPWWLEVSAVEIGVETDVEIGIETGVGGFGGVNMVAGFWVGGRHLVG